MRIYSQSAIVAAALLSGLALPVHSEELQKKLADVRVFVTETCPVSRQTPEALGVLLAAAIVPQLVSSGLDFVSAALTAAGQDKATTLRANTVFSFYRSDGEGKLDRSHSFGCLVIVGSEFGLDAENVDAGPSTFPKETWESAQIKEDPRLALKQAPRFYFEAKVIFDRQKGTFRLAPVLYRIAAPYEKSFFGGAKISTAITVSFSVPGANTPFASFVVSLPESDLPVEVQKTGLFGITSPWMPMYPVNAIVSEKWEKERKRATAVDALQAKQKTAAPLPDSPDIKAMVTAYCGLMKANPKAKDKTDATNCPENYEARLSAINAERAKAALAVELDGLRKAIDPKTPEQNPELAQTNAEVVVVETRKGSRFAAFLGAALAASKADIVSAVKTQLPQAKKAAEETAANAQSDADVAALTAKANVAVAQGALDALDTSAAAALRQQKEIELLAAKIKANKAFRQAGLSEPYGGISIN